MTEVNPSEIESGTSNASGRIIGPHIDGSREKESGDGSVELSGDRLHPFVSRRGVLRSVQQAHGCRVALERRAGEGVDLSTIQIDDEQLIKMGLGKREEERGEELTIAHLTALFAMESISSWEANRVTLDIPKFIMCMVSRTFHSCSNHVEEVNTNCGKVYLMARRTSF